MPGRNTGLRGEHPTRRGAFVESIKAGPECVAALAGALGRSLTPDELGRVTEAVLIARELRDAQHATPPRQDVLRTLRAIAQADDATAARLAADCDAATEGFVFGYLARGSLTVQQAAAEALVRFEAHPARAGRHSAAHQRRLTADAVALWRDFGGSARPASQRLAWVLALLDEIEGQCFDSRRAERLIANAQREARNDFCR